MKRDRYIGYLTELISRYLKGGLGCVKKVTHLGVYTYISLSHANHIRLGVLQRSVQLQIQRDTAPQAYPRGYYF